MGGGTEAQAWELAFAGGLARTVGMSNRVVILRIALFAVRRIYAIAGRSCGAAKLHRSFALLRMTRI